MKVLIISNGSEQGGAPKSMLEMILNIRKNYGVEYVVAIPREGTISEFCRKNNIEYVITNHRNICIGRGSTFLRRFYKLIIRFYYTIRNFIYNKKAVSRLSKQIDISTIDLIHTNSNRDGLGALLKKKYNIKHIWHLREFGKEDYDTVFLFPYNVKFMNKNADMFIANSNAVKNSWMKKGINENKISVVYNGVELCPTPNLSFNTEEMKMVFLGTICPSKGQEDLIKSIPFIDEEIKTKIFVDFYGNVTNDYYRRLCKLIKKERLTNNFRFMGLSSNIYDTLENYDYGLVCSKCEAFGRITPEYMSAGLIVIESNSGGNLELIEDGINGFLYNQGSMTSLAKTIEKIYYMEKEKLYDVAKNAIEHSKKFSVDINAMNVFLKYEECVKNEA